MAGETGGRWTPARGTFRVRIHAPRALGTARPWPSTNDLVHALNRGRIRGNDLKRRYTGIAAEYAREAAQQQGWRCPESPVDVWITWYEVDRRRDPDNIHGGIKFVMDGLVRAGVIHDDSQRWVRDIHHRIKYDAADPGAEVVLRAVAAERSGR